MRANNMKAMRKALEACLHTLKTTDWTALGTSSKVVDLIQKCEAALKEPPRECDIGNPKQQEARFMKECYRSLDCHPCRLCRKECDCRFWWGQLPHSRKRLSKRVRPKRVKISKNKGEKCN